MAECLRPIPLKCSMRRPGTAIADHRRRDDPAPVEHAQHQRANRAQAADIVQYACIYPAMCLQITEPELVIRHIRPASTTHNWPVHIRLSSDASHSTMRVTS